MLALVLSHGTRPVLKSSSLSLAKPSHIARDTAPIFTVCAVNDEIITILDYAMLRREDES